MRRAIEPRTCLCETREGFEGRLSCRVGRGVAGGQWNRGTTIAPKDLGVCFLLVCALRPSTVAPEFPPGRSTLARLEKAVEAPARPRHVDFAAVQRLDEVVRVGDGLGQSQGVTGKGLAVLVQR